MILLVRCFRKEKILGIKKIFHQKNFSSGILAFLAFYNTSPKTNDATWIYTMFLSNNRVSECKSGPFEDAQSMSKQPVGSAYLGNFINYLLYLPVPFPRGLCIYLEGNSIFLPLLLLIDIDRLGLFSHL